MLGNGRREAGCGARLCEARLRDQAASVHDLAENTHEASGSVGRLGAREARQRGYARTSVADVWRSSRGCNARSEKDVAARVDTGQWGTQTTSKN